jgi:Protein of unknown function (DUF4239)
MNLYWIYDIPNWQFFLLTEIIFIGFSLSGTFLFSEYFEKKLGLTEKHNEIVSNFLSMSGVFYGITLGLIAVGTFENFKSVEGIVNDEASALAALYRDVSILEEPDKQILKSTLKKYTEYVVNQAWPSQQKGIIPKGDTKIIDTFQIQFAHYMPESDRDKIFYAEVFDQFNVLIEKRRARLNSVSGGLPSSIWLVLFLGAGVNIVITWLLVIKNRKFDILINVLSGSLVGSIIFLIAAMDNPFRGEFSVSNEPFVLLLEGLMK